MKKTTIIAIAALILSVSMAGCGKKTDSVTNSGTDGNTADVSDSYNKADGGNASGSTAADVPVEFSEDLVDMDKIPGDDLSSESAKKEYDGELGTSEVSIEDAKVIDYDGDKVAIVSFDYKNNSSIPTPFTGNLTVEAYQNGSKLPTTVVVGVEGVTMLALSENLEKGQSLEVQMAFKLREDDAPLEVYVSELNPTDDDSQPLVKVFDMN